MKGRLIAVVDDDASLRKALRRLLRANGYHTEAYSSGSEFFQALALSIPDCVVLDVCMTPIGGLEIQEELTRRCMKLPIVFITATDDVITRDRALSCGAIAYLQKPLGKQALLKVLAGITDASA